LLRAAADSAASKPQRANTAALAAAFEFTLLLDEVGRDLEPAYVLKRDYLLGRIQQDEMSSRTSQARPALESAPIEQLFRAYASRVRSKGDLGVLSSLNQRLWLQYRELQQFLNEADGDSVKNR
jgi:hypothetical protein